MEQNFCGLHTMCSRELLSVFVICGRPKSINESKNVAYDIIDAVSNACKELGDAVLLNCIVDSVSCACEASWCRSQVNNYLTWETHVFGLIDSNNKLNFPL